MQEPPQGNPFEALGLGGGIGAAMGLEHTDHHIGAGATEFLALLEHPIGLADPRGHADEELVAAPSLG